MGRVMSYNVTIKLDWANELLCKTHFDRHQEHGYMAGQAFTSWRCKHCKTEFMHHNTGHPQICLNCALQRKECQRCMGPLEDEMLSITENRRED